MAGYYPITIESGATFQLPLQITDGNNVPINLTNVQPVLVLVPRDGSASITCNSSNGKLTITNAINGNLLLNLSAVETATYIWKSGKYYFDIEYPGNFVERYLEGTVAISPPGT